jgi:molecular chaperone GrpE
MNDRTNGAPEDPPGTPAGTPTGHPSHARSGGSRAAERIAGLDTAAAASAQQQRIDELEAQLEAAVQRAAEAESGWQRARADYANLKRRVEEERSELASLASDRLLSRVLELADDFDLAIDHVPAEARGSAWLEGISVIDRKLRGILEAEGVAPMGGEGEPFDPRTQQAISYEDSSDVADGTVLRVLQRGYAIGDRVLRPALVAVARNDATTASPSDTPPPD